MIIIERKILKSHDGVDISYYIRKGTKPTMMFIHGVGANHTVWTPITKHFSATTINVDLRGHGRSSIGKISAITIENYARDLYDILETEDAKDVVLVGNSLGATIAIELARLSPRVKRLFLFSVFSKEYSALNTLLGIANNVAYLFIRPFPMKRKLNFQDYARKRKLLPWFFPIVDIKGTHLHVYCKTIIELLKTTLKFDIRQDTLILHGARDHMSSRAKLYKRTANKKNITLIAHKKHHLIVNKAPSACVRMIKEFLDKN